MLDKRMTLTDAVGQLQNGMTIGIGGWGPRRKPMALVREILRSNLTDLTVVAYGGADVGMLAAAGRIRKLVFAFVSLDAIPLEPWFRKARDCGLFSWVRRIGRYNGLQDSCLYEKSLPPYHSIPFPGLVRPHGWMGRR